MQASLEWPRELPAAEQDDGLVETGIVQPKRWQGSIRWVSEFHKESDAASCSAMALVVQKKRTDAGQVGQRER